MRSEHHQPVERGALPENDSRLRDRTRKPPPLPPFEPEALNELRLAARPDYVPACNMRGHRMELLDIRPDVSAHAVSVFTVEHAPDERFGSALPHLLGVNTKRLLLQWGMRLDRWEPIPTASRVVLVHDAHSMHTYSPPDAQGSDVAQSTHLACMGLSLAEPPEATIVCAAAVSMAKKAGLNLQRLASTWAEAQAESFGKLQPEVSDLLVKLRQGELATSVGGLYIDEIGELCASLRSLRHPLCFALGTFSGH